MIIYLLNHYIHNFQYDFLIFQLLNNLEYILDYGRTYPNKLILFDIIFHFYQNINNLIDRCELN